MYRANNFLFYDTLMTGKTLFCNHSIFYHRPVNKTDNQSSYPPHSKWTEFTKQSICTYIEQLSVFSRKTYSHEGSFSHQWSSSEV